ncbi:MAG: tRNA 2-thiouridine(34) synthase MnmA [Patescibacteria group bacterium]|jgi:tRNA-specific 2-thiouridylase
MNAKNINKTVAIAMSGGVDSSVAAALLVKAGYDCFGVFMHFWTDPTGMAQKDNKCCSLASFEDARRVCQKLGIKLYTLNFDEIFKEKIVDSFLCEYAKGKTPNPCVACNKFIKCGALLQKVRAMGADYLATGHYIKKARRAANYQLLVAEDKEKDQTYFLYNLKQSDLKYLLFPVGDYTKLEVRGLAKKFHLPTAEKRESQEICFVPEKDHNEFLRRYLKMKPGKIVDTKGNAVGDHLGLPLYTIGQRKGVGSGEGPYYVTGFDLKKNRLIVTNNPNDKKLFSDKLVAGSVNWVVGKSPKLPFKCLAKIRYRHPAVPVVVSKSGGKIVVRFKTPQRAVTQGQSIVFYAKRGRQVELLGGGVIK